MVFEELLGRYLSGELSSEEEMRFQEALSQKPELKHRLDEFRKIWDSMEGVAAQQGYDMDTEWSALSGKIPDFHADRTAPGKVRSLLYYSYRIAAVLFVGVLISFAWIYCKQNCRYTGDGSRDGTHGDSFGGRNTGGYSTGIRKSGTGKSSVQNPGRSHSPVRPGLMWPGIPPDPLLLMPEGPW